MPSGRVYQRIYNNAKRETMPTSEQGSAVMFHRQVFNQGKRGLDIT